MMIAVWLKLKLTDVQLDNWFANKHGFTGYIISALAGSITPFCSCTTIPIFTGMIDSKLRHGWAITFLIASPTINPPAIILFYALFDIKLTIIYITYIDQHSYFGKWHQRNYKNNFILYKYINGSFSK